MSDEMKKNRSIFYQFVRCSNVVQGLVYDDSEFYAIHILHWPIDDFLPIRLDVPRFNFLTYPSYTEIIQKFH